MKLIKDLIKNWTLPFFINVLIFTFFALLLSPSAEAAYCLRETSDGNLRIDATAIETCSSGLILLDKTDYDAISIDGIVLTLIDLFEFSADDFSLINASILISFITGHVLGRIVRLFGKT